MLSLLVESDHVCSLDKGVDEAWGLKSSQIFDKIEYIYRRLIERHKINEIPAE